MLRPEIKEYIDDLDCSAGSFSIHDISGKIREIIQKEDIRSIEDDAEIFAFNVYTEGQENTAWNSYFGPMMSFANNDGSPSDFPSRNVITEETLKYWEVRMNESKHSALKGRYADLLIEFSSLVGRRLEIETAKISIESHLEGVNKKYELGLSAKDSLGRVISLIKKFNLNEFFEVVLQTAISLEQEIGEDDKPGLWGFVFDWFVLDSDITIPDKTISSIVTSMEQRHKRLLEKKDLWPLKSATLHLANYYIKTGENIKLRSILNAYEKLIYDLHEFIRGTMGELHYLQDLEELYVSYAATTDIKSDLGKIRTQLKNFRIDSEKSEFSEISVETQISTAKINALVNDLFKSKAQTETIAQIVRTFLNRKESDKKSLSQISQKYIFAQLVTGNIFDQENRLVAQIPPLKDSPDAHLRMHSSQNIDISSFILETVLQKFVEEYSSQEFIAVLLSSVCFSECNNLLLDKIIKTYWEGDYFNFTHTATPFVESGIRRLLTLAGMSVTKNNNVGGFDYSSLNFLLDNVQTNAIFEQMFGTVGSDVIYSIKLTLVDVLGQNIRNKVAHGIYQPDFFNRKHADNLIKVIFILSMIQKKPSLN